MTGGSPYDAVLACILRARRDPAALENLNPAALDWPALIARANQERITPLLYKILEGQGERFAAQLPLLRGVYLESMRTNGQRLGLLEKAGQRLSAAGVETVLLKGASLAEPVYRNLALRPMTDLDLLVRPGQVQPALEALAGLGYSQVDDDPYGGATDEYRNEIELSNPNGSQPMIEIHWTLLQPPYYQEKISTDWVWSQTRPYPCGRARFLRLDPELEMLYLCAHLYLKHFGEGLLWLNDLAELAFACASEIQWPGLLAQARTLDLLLPLQKGLARAAAELAAPVPAEFLRELAAAKPSREEQRLFARFATAYQSPAQAAWALLEDMKSPRARLHFALMQAFPPPAYMRRRYGIRSRWLVPFYYPYRWVIGLKKRMISEG